MNIIKDGKDRKNWEFLKALARMMNQIRKQEGRWGKFEVWLERPRAGSRCGYIFAVFPQQWSQILSLVRKYGQEPQGIKVLPCEQPQYVSEDDARHIADALQKALRAGDVSVDLDWPLILGGPYPQPKSPEAEDVLSKVNSLVQHRKKRLIVHLILFCRRGGFEIVKFKRCNEWFRDHLVNVYFLEEDLGYLGLKQRQEVLDQPRGTHFFFLDRLHEEKSADTFRRIQLKREKMDSESKKKSDTGNIKKDRVWAIEEKYRKEIK